MNQPLHYNALGAIIVITVLLGIALLMGWLP